MAWYTDLFCNVTFTRETYNNIYEVKDRIDELKQYIQTAKNSIKDLVVMTEPNKFCSEGEEPLCWITNEFNGNMKLIEDYTVELYKLNLLLENWNYCHNKDGLAINPPKEITSETAFLDGDFVKSIKRPNVNE